jgi:hypothetical protein
MNRINAADREKKWNLKQKHQELELLQSKAEAESKRLQGQGIADQRREIARGLVESVDVLNRYQLSRSICLNCGYTALRYLTSYRR